MEITVQQVELLSDDDYIYLDVRGEIAYQHGHIPKAYEWAGDFSHIEELPKDKRLIVYCNYGEKSAPIAEQLRQEGYEALNLSGGYREWLLHVTSQKEQMQDVSKDGLHLFSSTEELTPDEVKRYHPSRNLIRKDPEVDEIKRRSLVDCDGTPRMPKAPKGYYVDPESIEVGINPITHYAYRHYTLIKIKKRE